MHFQRSTLYNYTRLPLKHKIPSKTRFHQLTSNIETPQAEAATALFLGAACVPTASNKLDTQTQHQSRSFQMINRLHGKSNRHYTFSEAGLEPTGNIAEVSHPSGSCSLPPDRLDTPIIYDCITRKNFNHNSTDERIVYVKYLKDEGEK